MEKSFEWFDLESAVNTTPKATHVKLNGMGNFMKVVNSTSRSTEEFIAGAISSLGQADRNIMYVNSTLGGLDDRLRLCAKIARPVNTAKARSVEGFENVPYLNPWEYAIEGKVGDFFSKIWAAIRSIAGKILDAIINFIKFIGNKISELSSKSMNKDREKFIKNSADIMAKVNAAKVGDQEISALPWNRSSGDGMTNMIKNLLVMYLKATKKDDWDQKVLEGVSSSDLNKIEKEEDFVKTFGKIFGINSASDLVHSVGGKMSKNGGIFSVAQAKVKQFHEEINALIHQGASVVKAPNNTGAKEAINTALFGKASVEVTKQKIKDIVAAGGGDQGDKAFIVLSNNWLAENVTNTVSTLHEVEKEFTKYTKNIDKVAKKFDSIRDMKGNNASSLSKLTADLAKDRCRLNSYYSSLILTAVSYAFRLRKSVHIALKAYLKVGGKAEKDKKKSSESYRRPQSIESMFTF